MPILKDKMRQYQLVRNWIVKSKDDLKIYAVCVLISFCFLFFSKFNKTSDIEDSLLVLYDVPAGWSFERIPQTKYTIKYSSSHWNAAVQQFNKHTDTLKVSLEAISQQTLQWSSLKNIVRKIDKYQKVQLIDSNEDIHIELQPSDTIAVSVKPIVLASLVNGFSVAPYAKSDKISIIGTKSALTQLKEVLTDTLRFDQKEQGELDSFWVKVVLPDSRYSTDQPTVLVDLALEEGSVKTIQVPVTVINAPAGYEAFPKKVTIHCSVSIDNYEKISDNSFVVVADYMQSGFDDNDFRKAPIVIMNYPKFLKKVWVDDKNIKIKLIKKSE
jgi:hypothetical protein